MGKLALKSSAVSAFVVVVASACVACSSSSSSGAAASGDGGGGGGGSKGPCPSIVMADAQALVPETITSITDDGVLSCDLNTSAGVSLQINYYPTDGDLTAYNNLSADTDNQQISGIGDKAYWGEPSDGQTPPQLTAHKGVVTCVIQSNDPPDTTMKTTANGTGYTVTASDALAYVQLMGKVCNEVLNAAQ